MQACCSIKVDLLIGAGIFAGKEIVVYLDGSWATFVRILLTLLLLAVAVRCLSLLVLLEDDVVVVGIGCVLEQLGIELKERTSGHEGHLGFVFAALGDLRCNFGLKLGLFARCSILLPLHEGFKSDWGQAIVGQGSPLGFNLFFKRHFIITVFALLALVSSIDHVALGKHVPVLTIVASARTHPIEAVLFVLDGVQKVATRNNRVGRLSYLGSWVRIQIDGHLPIVLKG